MNMIQLTKNIFTALVVVSYVLIAFFAAFHLSSGMASKDLSLLCFCAVLGVTIGGPIWGIRKWSRYRIHRQMQQIAAYFGLHVTRKGEATDVMIAGTFEELDVRIVIVEIELSLQRAQQVYGMLNNEMDATICTEMALRCQLLDQQHELSLEENILFFMIDSGPIVSHAIQGIEDLIEQFRQRVK